MISKLLNNLALQVYYKTWKIEGLKVIYRIQMHLKLLMRLPMRMDLQLKNIKF
jgi:hypothetical protein